MNTCLTQQSFQVMKKETLIDIISYAFIILFVYTGVNKLISFNFYLRDLHRSPLLGPYATAISILIPAAELIAAVLLIRQRTRIFGLQLSLFLMTAFTIYVGYVLTFTDKRPCTCGGIIRELSWPNHMIFNVTFLLLAISGIILQTNRHKTNYA
jgi:putative oxidoreductase